MKVFLRSPLLKELDKRWGVRVQEEPSDINDETTIMILSLEWTSFQSGIRPARKYVMTKTPGAELLEG